MAEGENIMQDIQDEEEKSPVLKLIFAAVFYAVAMCLKHLHLPYSDYICVALFLLSYLLCGLDTVKNAVFHIIKGHVFDEQFLMTIASFAALAIGEYPEAVAVMLFYQVGEFFQDYTVAKSRHSISALQKTMPDVARVVRKNQEEIISLKDVDIGDIVIVKPGEKIPLDALIIEGNAFVDTSAITGESVPKKVQVGESVFQGFIDTDSLLKLKVVKTSEDSSVAKILDLTMHSEQKKSRKQKFITRFASYYTPIVVCLAVLIAVVPLFMQGTQYWTLWTKRAIIFLVVSCPCALVISIPLGFIGGIASCARQGILVKGACYLEELASVKTAVFDKTGTLTKGNFCVTGIYPAGERTQEELLSLAFAIERFSNHPIAKSLQKAYSKEKEYNKELQDFVARDIREISGKGLECYIENKLLLVGNKALMIQRNISDVLSINDEASTVLYICYDSEYLGYITIADEIKDNAKTTIKKLKSQGVTKTVMLTGDSKKVAESVAKNISLDCVYAELLPQDKLTILEKEMSPNFTLIYVGDGINDAPVLARSDVGFAIAAMGQDVAIQACDVVIMSDDILRVSTAISIAKKTRIIVWENIIIALVAKGCVMVTGALGLTGIWLAVAADVGVACLAILNAMRTLIKPKLL